MTKGEILMSPEDHSFHLKIGRVNRPANPGFVHCAVRCYADVLPSARAHDPFPATSGIKLTKRFYFRAICKPPTCLCFQIFFYTAYLPEKQLLELLLWLPPAVKIQPIL